MRYQKRGPKNFFDAGMIYPISDSPWVSPVHCVPKKGGITVIANEENELISTRLVTGWRVCIDYRKLNEATRKDHFPLPFMDQMIERLAGNEFLLFSRWIFRRILIHSPFGSCSSIAPWFQPLLLLLLPLSVLEVLKLLDAGMIYPISDSPWVSPVHCVPKKGGITVVANEENELISTRLVTGWRVCIDYRKLNEATRKDHFPLPFMDQMIERLAGNEFYCFLDGFSGYFQIPIDPQDQEKTTFTCPYGTFAYRRMPFGLCNAPGTFQRCMMAIFHDMIEKTMEVFMDDFSFLGIVLIRASPI
ncbi:reverse transcriptase domain-containing protein [Tanacetum coccineum]